MCPQILTAAMSKFPAQNTLELHPKLKPESQGLTRVRGVLPAVHAMGMVSVTPQRGWDSWARPALCQGC